MYSINIQYKMSIFFVAKNIYKNIQQKHFIFYDFTQVFCTFCVIIMRHKVGEVFNAKCLVPTIKHEGGSIIMQTCTSATKYENNVLCQERINSANCFHIIGRFSATNYKIVLVSVEKQHYLSIVQQTMSLIVKRFHWRIGQAMLYSKEYLSLA